METIITNIKLDLIKIEEFAIIELKNSVEKNVGYQTNFEYSLNDSDFQLGSIINVQLLQEDKVLLKLLTTIVFGIKKEDYLTFKSEKRVVIPQVFLKSITDISFNIVRGILFAKLEQTEYRKYTLPLADLSTVIIGDEVFDL